MRKAEIRREIFQPVNRFLIALAGAAPLWVAAAEGWPGLPPDCWSEPRLVHSMQEPAVDWQKHTRIVKRRAAKPAAAQISPNKAYMFAVENSRPMARVMIYAEKDYVLDIEFYEIFNLGEVRWLNEKLVFMRAWWARIAATDLIYDVEREQFIYAEPLAEASAAFRQYRESCPLHGCTCIKKN